MLRSIFQFFFSIQRQRRDSFQPTVREVDQRPKHNTLSKSSHPFDQATSSPCVGGETLVGSAYVIDGDSIIVRKTQIRLFGIDAPELDHPFGQKAKWAMVNLCKGQKIRAEVTDRDTHGRTVAKCYLDDGRDLSAELVKLGLAIDWPKYSNGKYQLLERPDVRKKLWLADARQKGRMHVWRQFEARNQKS